MTYIEKRIQQLIAFDNIRLGKFMEFIQFSLIFTFLAIISTYLINKHVLFSLTDNDSFFKTLIILSLELAFLTIVIFYLRKISLIIPSVATFLFSNFKPYTTIDMGMWMILVFVLIGSIDKLNDKVTLLKNKVNNYMGMGTIVKVPGDNDHILSKKFTGTEKMVDNYNVVLEVNPHNYYWNKTVTYLEKSDLEKVE